MPRSNREALLRGAASCIATKGYARTTARDIATASGVSLAAIGYHFGSTDALLQDVIFQGIKRWSQDLDHLLADSGRDQSAESLAHVWTRVRESFEGHRGVLLASYELLLRAEEKPEVRRRLTEALADARRGLAQILGGVDPATEPDRAQHLGAFHYTVLSGLLTQWLIDPAQAPTGADLAAALQEIRSQST